ncbi:MAG: molybdopterin-dependent oxidoreductase [Dehalococcoidia bacterium]|uniref:molybdopterin-dependent oxidoreductase n=1 Tax=Candidatus Amarobacter glycogenicus TaxID=3140699 RepID=UPI0031358193|nr:molybdopterin-dependent oxidoreductase [Dehalococcoidia bacterium]
MNKYRENTTWDSVHWGTHCVDCYPGGCPMRVYVKDGVIVREEPSGTLPVIDPAVPDFNPMGCMQGTSWSQSLHGPDRAQFPLKRAGKRGEGKWDRISWDQALREISDILVDAIEEHGPRSIIREGTPEAVVGGPTGRFFGLIGGQAMDLNAVIGDFNSGVYATFGKSHVEGSADDWFHSELLVIWNSNPVYTRIPFYHFFSEARYNGAEIINVSPDVNPSHTHADYQVNLEGASDAAFGLSLVQVMFAEDIAHWDFMREQTDMPLLVRRDNRKFLRQPDVEGLGREDQLYHWHPEKGLVLANRETLKLDGARVALEGEFDVRLHDGRTVTVEPVCAVLRRKLDEHYTPEKQQAITGVHPDVIRLVARKIATKRTNIFLGMNACKMYHGDLIERTMSLVLAASGNWGKKGTGLRTWASGLHDGAQIAMNKRGPGAEASEAVIAGRDNAIAMVKKMDSSLVNDELAMYEMVKGRRGLLGMMDERTGDDVPAEANTPPVFWWYNQMDFRERWNNPDWSDRSMARTFDEYMNAAIEAGWWDGLDHPRKDAEPQVYIECGGNTFRRTRGGKKSMAGLWSRLRAVIAIDFKFNATVQNADYFLPAAQHYEKVAFSIPGPFVANLTLADKIVEPAGEARSEWDIFLAILGAVAERAKERGLEAFTAPDGSITRYDRLVAGYTMGGYYKDEETVADEQIRDSALAGTLPEGATLAKLRETGFMRFTSMGMSPYMLGQATELKPDNVITPFTKHIELGEPFPTYCRRAQFYIDHEWFLEGDEQLPTYKPNPTMGGDYPLGMSSGHNRWSVHSMNHFNRLVLGTHRGSPSVMVNPDDAEARGVKDDDLVRIFNDLSEFHARVKVAPNVKPGQIVSYNGWEPMQYRNWSGANEIEPGMVKWLGFSGGYGHIKYNMLNWQPVPADRWVRCDFEVASE